MNAKLILGLGALAGIAYVVWTAERVKKQVVNTFDPSNQPLAPHPSGSSNSMRVLGVDKGTFGFGMRVGDIVAIPQRASMQWTDPNMFHQVTSVPNVPAGMDTYQFVAPGTLVISVRGLDGTDFNNTSVAVT